jgi:SNF2 family DNA or RNA helicase
MSGTPMPQSTSDIISQFDFLWPGGDVLEEASRANDETKRIEIVNRTVKPLYVRTTKGELGLKPPKIHFTNIKLGPVQSELYELLRSEAARIISDIDRNDINAFRRLGKQVVRLLQVASNPALITSSSYYEDLSPIVPGTTKWKLLTEFSRFEKPAKIEYTLKRVRELCKKDHKVVIWSVFVQNIELLEKRLSDLGAVSIYGCIETGDENEINTREWRIRRFHEDPTCKVLVANPAACGEGISLHKICHHAIYLDRTFNAAHYLQSVDRIHRLGLPSDVTTNVEILYADDTIDGTVGTRLKNKISAMSRVLEDIDLRALAYDPDDIIEDIPGGIDRGDIDDIKQHLEGKK